MPKEVPYERIESAPPVILEAEVLPRLAKPLPPLPKASPVPRVRELDWREKPPPKISSAIPDVPSADLALPRSPRNIWALVLTGLIVTIVLLIAAAGFKVLLDRSRAEEYLAHDANESFRERNYAQAASQFGELLAKYPDGPNVQRYRFFEALSGLHTALGSVTLKEDPEPARQKWDAFLTDFAESPLASTDQDGYGLDIYEAGRRLCDGMTSHAEGRLKQYRAELTKLDNLKAAETTTAEVRKLLPVVNRYRPKDGESLDDISSRLDALSAQTQRERHRLDVLAPYRDLATDPIEERIAEFSATLARTGFSDDAEANNLIAAAGARLRSLLKPIPDERPAQELRPTGQTQIVTVATPTGSLPVSPIPQDQRETFLAVARGWLYALDVDSAELLWSTRIGPTVAPFRIQLPDSGTELALVASRTEGHAALTARHIRTGKPIWHQPLEAPIAGACAQVGSRVYVPLADATGTMVEIDLHQGRRLSHIRLRQRIGAGIVRVPNTNLIAVVAEARRIYIIDTAPKDTQGERLPLRLIHVMRTDHPPMSIRVPPLFNAVEESRPKSMLLLQHEGTNTVRIRSVVWPESAMPSAESVVPESIAVDLANAALPGQVTFPPATDGERVAVVTDVGAFGLYWTRFPGNLDNGLFIWPATALPMDMRDPLPALTALGREDLIWVFARGQRTMMQQSLTASTGARALSRGAALPCGLPTQIVQQFPERGLAGIVTRSQTSDSVRATVFDCETGQVRWERALGVAAAAAPLLMNECALLIDEDGGVQRLTANSKDRAELLLSPITAATGPARVATSGKTVWIITPLLENRVQVRQLEVSKVIRDFEVPLPAALAGEPIVMGESLVVPLTDGFLHRLDTTSRSFTAGPMWRGNRQHADAICYLAAGPPDEVLASDGDRRINRWHWPAGAEWSSRGAPFVLQNPAALAPSVITGPQTQLLAAETSGTILLFDLDRPSEPVRQWRPGDDKQPAIPPGRPTHGFQLLRINGRLLAVYAIDQRTLVTLSPDQAEPAWVFPIDANDYDIRGLQTADGMVYVTDLSGSVMTISAEGRLTARASPPSRDLLPRTYAVPFQGRFLLPLMDGTLISLPINPRTK